MPNGWRPSTLFAGCAIVGFMGDTLSVFSSIFLVEKVANETVSSEFPSSLSVVSFSLSSNAVVVGSASFDQL